MPPKRMPTVEVWEGTRRVVSMIVKDTRGVAIPLENMTSIAFSLKTRGGSVINGRDAQDVKNNNGGTYHATSGRLEVVLTPEDNRIVEGARLERHAAVLVFGYARGNKSDSVAFSVDVTRVS